MKQHITIEQLNELSDKGKKALIQYGRKHLELTCFADQEWNSAIASDLILPIGQMIEFLFDNDFGPQIFSNDNAFYWTVEPEKKLDCWKKFSYENSELCDALWEAVKDILEHD